MKQHRSGALRISAALTLTLAAVVLLKPTDVLAAPDGRALVTKYSCIACHGMTNKIVGPGYSEVAAKYKGQPGAEAKLMEKIRKGGSGSWGAIPMPPQPQVSDQDLKVIVDWVLAGAK